MTDAESEAAWLARREHGTVLGIRFFVACCTLLGRTATRWVLRFVMLYYFVFARRARKASRDFLSYVRGRRASAFEVYRHLATFALVTLDRVFFLKGRTDLFQVETSGSELLDAMTQDRRGAILLGGHVGSFEAMRARAGKRGHDIHMLAYLENSRKLMQVLNALAPEMAARIIELGTTDSLIRAQGVVEQGGMIAMLGDRTGLNKKTVLVDFMGRPAPFPTGPFLVASALKCPVFVVFGIYQGGNRYELSCELLAEKVELPRGNREAALVGYVQEYARRLERVARAHPLNWFNMYDFWAPNE